MILISKCLVPKGYTGMTIFPFVFLKHQKLKADTVLINHEKIHLRQQLELLVIPFYMFYLIEFIFRLVQYRNWRNAYRNISFERESYSNEHNLQYLEQRSFFGFLSYINHYDI